MGTVIFIIELALQHNAALGRTILDSFIPSKTFSLHQTDLILLILVSRIELIKEQVNEILFLFFFFSFPQLFSLFFFSARCSMLSLWPLPTFCVHLNQIKNPHRFK
jgi:hypothetical protein